MRLRNGGHGQDVVLVILVDDGGNVFRDQLTEPTQAGPLALDAFGRAEPIDLYAQFRQRLL